MPPALAEKLIPGAFSYLGVSGAVFGVLGLRGSFLRDFIGVT